jgi:enamine deaminase RidA (YjgF/YER057c/UK114 family)
MPKEHINPDTLFPSVPHGFSQVIATHGGKTIYISGQTAWDAEKRLVGGNSLEAQAKQALQNVRHAVEAAGGSLADVVTLRLYVVNYRPADANSLGGVLREFFPGLHPPTSTWIGVSSPAVADFLIEIEAVAVLE